MVNVRWIPVARYLFTCALLYRSFSELFVRIWWNSADLISFYFRRFRSNFLHVVFGRVYKKKITAGEKIWCCCPAFVTLASYVEGHAYSGWFLRDCTQSLQPSNEVRSWVALLFWYLDGVSASYPDLRLIHTFRMVETLPSWPQQIYFLKVCCNKDIVSC